MSNSILQTGSEAQGNKTGLKGSRVRGNVLVRGFEERGQSPMLGVGPRPLSAHFPALPLAVSLFPPAHGFLVIQ